MDLIVYLETRLEAIEILVKLHGVQTGDYLVSERAICAIQLDKIKLQMREKLNSI